MEDHVEHLTLMVEDDAPNRCQHSRAYNQCKYNVLPNRSYCQYHIALYDKEFRKTSRLKKYKLVQHYMRVDELVSSPELKNLSEEIGILNMTLETLVNQCHTPWDLQINQHRIESLVEKIAKTTQINQRLQTAIGKTLDETTLASLMDAVTKAIIDENLPEDSLKRISQRIAKALEKAKEPKLLPDEIQ